MLRGLWPRPRPRPVRRWIRRGGLIHLTGLPRRRVTVNSRVLGGAGPARVRPRALGVMMAPEVVTLRCRAVERSGRTMLRGRAAVGGLQRGHSRGTSRRSPGVRIRFLIAAELRRWRRCRAWAWPRRWPTHALRGWCRCWMRLASRYIGHPLGWRRWRVVIQQRHDIRRLPRNLWSWWGCCRSCGSRRGCRRGRLR